MSERRRVVITGLGVVTAAGCDVESFWASLCAGRSAVAPIRGFDASGFPTRFGAEVDDREIMDEPLGPRWANASRVGRLAAIAAARAVRDAGEPFDGPTDRFGVSLGTGITTWDHDELLRACAAGGRAEDRSVDWASLFTELRQSMRPEARRRFSPGAIPTGLAADCGITGRALAVMNACAAGTQAIGDATRWIRSGAADAALAGGSGSELSPMGLASFCLLGALSRRNDAPAAASRPFDGARDGFVLGEGAALLVLEERERAIRRGARVYAEVAGFGAAADAYRITDPHPDGDGAVLAMQRALREAECEPGAIDYINAHGTSTPANDRTETRALKRLLGPRAAGIPISSTKSMIGHATVAAGAIEAAATALTISRQIIHPTINHDMPDPDCDLDYVPNVARPARVRLALSNSFGFGGQMAALLLREHVA